MRISIEQRRARLARRHHLARAAQGKTVAEVARDLVGLHSTDPVTVYLSAHARVRVRAATVEAIGRELYEERSVLRVLGMRRTMFVVPAEVAPVIQAACTVKIAGAMRRRLVGLVETAGIAKNGERWLDKAERATIAALEAQGEAAAAELSKEVPQLREKIMFGEGKKWEGHQSVSTLLLNVMAAEGRMIRGRPRGTWISSQYRWVPTASWLARRADEWGPVEARAELVRRWLWGFGPATITDIRWWTGLTAGELKPALAAIAPVEVDLDGERGLVLADDLAPVSAPKPWAALLPSLDSTVMGWKVRDWYLGPHGPRLFDRAGNAGPTVWWEGRVVGGWAQRPSGEIAVELLEDVGADALAAIDAEAERLRKWFGDTRVTPRFRTPVERELLS